MKILLAADGSPYTSKAAEFLVSHFNWFEESPELHVVHAMLSIPISESRATAVVGRDAVDNYYRQQAGEALAPAERILKQHGVSFKAGYVIGDIAQQLNGYAMENGIDLIVMGTHGHGAWNNLVMGSVATKVRAITELPVLLVK
jgi:nucleotide-binding universal stress UspA family protein